MNANIGGVMMDHVELKKLLDEHLEMQKTVTELDRFITCASMSDYVDLDTRSVHIRTTGPAQANIIAAVRTTCDAYQQRLDALNAIFNRFEI